MNYIIQNYNMGSLCNGYFKAAKIFTIVVLLLCQLFFSKSGYAQRKSQLATLEIFGNGDYISLNYDSRFRKQKSGLGFRVGIGSRMDDIRPFQPSLSTPVGINYLLGKNKGFAEIGVVAIPDIDFGSSYGRNYFTFKTRANIGYRYISKKGIMLNALWTPLLTTSSMSERKQRHLAELLWLGFGAGISL